MPSFRKRCAGVAISLWVLVGSSLAQGKPTAQFPANAATSPTSHAGSSIQILSDSYGFDFAPCLDGIVKSIKANWYNLIPDKARPPLNTKGTVVIQFAIMKDGKVGGMKLDGPSGEVSLDRAAWGSIAQSSPFPPLPPEFPGEYLLLRLKFFYNEPPGLTARLSTVGIDHGSVSGRTYLNPSLGLEFKAAPKLQFLEPQLKGGTDAKPQFLTVAAWAKQKGESPREGTTFYAESLATYPADQRSTEAYMRKVSNTNRQDGFELEGSGLMATLSGVKFSRADFKKGPLYEAVLVDACSSYAFVFVFTGGNQDAVDKLISKTTVKLDPYASGCTPQTPIAPQKLNPVPSNSTASSATQR